MGEEIVRPVSRCPTGLKGGFAVGKPCIHKQNVERECGFVWVSSKNFIS